MTAPLTPLELALGVVIGTDPPAERTPAAPRDPLSALEAAVLPALRRPPCLVSFSGGRDSSAVLAVAARVARREGLADPVPVTIRALGAPAADEARWQELVVAHLGLDDWSRLTFADELDVVGPVAAGVLRRHGLLWPFNAHFHVPMLDAARGGALLTGIGGDELFGAATSPRAAAVLGARVRPVARDVRRVALYLAPRFARRRWHAHGPRPL
ncbi:MAG TPA: asparagine synthase-related protein, partial [Solirubrobacteraceae bacterium]|nr:asparagine synthase-related protein [Solirubrobacteraceae bacterium]